MAKHTWKKPSIQTNLVITFKMNIILFLLFFKILSLLFKIWRKKKCDAVFLEKLYRHKILYVLNKILKHSKYESHTLYFRYINCIFKRMKLNKFWLTESDIKNQNHSEKINIRRDFLITGEPSKDKVLLRIQKQQVINFIVYYSSYY